MKGKFECPLIKARIDETICYDIQMTIGPGSLINKNILDKYAEIFKANIISDDKAAKHCPTCYFNQLYGPLTKKRAAV